MLTKLSDLQESDETVWGTSSVSFSIETRLEDGSQIVQREYTFGHAEEWDKWAFQEFTEKKTEDTTSITEREWRQTRHIMWSDTEAPTIDVPPEVTEELTELLDLDEMVIISP